jgi:hypothetical protein
VNTNVSPANRGGSDPHYRRVREVIECLRRSSQRTALAAASDSTGFESTYPRNKSGKVWAWGYTHCGEKGELMTSREERERERERERRKLGGSERHYRFGGGCNRNIIWQFGMFPGNAR